MGTSQSELTAARFARMVAEQILRSRIGDVNTVSASEALDSRFRGH